MALKKSGQSGRGKKNGTSEVPFTLGIKRKKKKIREGGISGEGGKRQDPNFNPGGIGYHGDNVLSRCTDQKKREQKQREIG